PAHVVGAGRGLQGLILERGALGALVPGDGFPAGVAEGGASDVVLHACGDRGGDVGRAWIRVRQRDHESLGAVRVTRDTAGPRDHVGAGGWRVGRVGGNAGAGYRVVVLVVEIELTASRPGRAGIRVGAGRPADRAEPVLVDRAVDAADRLAVAEPAAHEGIARIRRA